MKFTDKENVIISKALYYARGWLEECINYKTNNEDKAYYKLFDDLQKKVDDSLPFEFNDNYELQAKINDILKCDQH